MASISLYDENQLCNIISIDGKEFSAPNQLFYVHEIPEIVKRIIGNNYNDNIKVALRLYPTTSTNDKTLNTLDVNSLITDQNLNNASFDFSYLFGKIFYNSSNELNFNGTFENCEGFELSSVIMKDTNRKDLNDFNRNYKQLTPDYLKSHMSDTFRNAVFRDISNITPNAEQYLSYNMILAWTAYIADTYQDYVDKVWALVNKKFTDIYKSNYEWSPSGLLNTSPEYTSTVINKTLQYEEIKEYLYNGIKTEPEYQKVFTGNDNDNKTRFNYAIDSVYILISKQIENVVDAFENMFNNHADFNFGYDLTSDNITTNFKSWLTGINNKLININTKYFDVNVVNKITDKSQLYNIREKLTYAYYVNNWTLRFSKNVDLILNNSEKITKDLAEEFYNHLNVSMYVDEWKTYYDTLSKLFDRLRLVVSKTLEDDLFNDLVLSIAYDPTNITINRIQKRFYEVFDEYQKDYEFSSDAIIDYIKETEIDNKRILRAAIEKRFSEYEFKNILNIVRGSVVNITNILKHVANDENVDSDYENSLLYSKFVSLFELYNGEENNVDYFTTFSNSIKSVDNKYVCDFKTNLDGYITITLDSVFDPEDNCSETVFSTTSDDDYLFNEFKTYGSNLISTNIKSTINSLNLTEVKYLYKMLYEYESKSDKIYTFSENIAQEEYYNYCSKYSNRLMLYDTENNKTVDVWKSSFTITNGVEFVPHDKFGKLIKDYYTNKVELLKEQYEKINNDSSIDDIQGCIDSLSNYLYDVECYDKKTGFTSDRCAKRTILIDTTLNRSLEFNVPMALNDNDNDYIYKIIERLEAKVREMESN